jgi:crotonobetainyl-CoA:carnitine CoA-transferase CaiB-like acyl-CoA transferase
LVYASLSGFGADGSLAALAGHDINYEALSGYLDMTGVPGGPPILPPIPIADLVGGSLLPAISIIALLMQARSLGRGGHIDAAMAEGMALLPNMVVADVLAGGAQAARGMHEHTGALASYRVYPLQDGHVAIGSLERKFWVALCEGLEAPDLLDKQQGDQEWLAAQIASRFSAMTKEEVKQRFALIDACVTVVESYSSLLDSDLARERGLVRHEPGFPMPLLAPPFVIDEERPSETLPAPRRGEHSKEILLEIGFSETDIEVMVAAGATLVL